MAMTIQSPSTNGRVPVAEQRSLAPVAPKPPELQSSYVQYLPAPYQGDSFTGRFLMIFESIIEPIERTIDNIPHYLDPKVTPADWLSWIAGWIGQDLDENWPLDRRRLLVSRAGQLHRGSGTRRSLKEHLEIYSGRNALVIENFDGIRLGQDSALGLNARIGEFKPHTVDVTIQVDRAGDVDERILHQIIEIEKPAHVVHTLHVLDREGRSLLEDRLAREGVGAVSVDAASLADRVRILRRLDLFSALTPVELERLAGGMRHAVFRRGAAIIHQGEMGESMFVLMEGQLEALVAPPGGRRLRPVGTIRPGEVFGEMSLLTGEPRSATIEVLVDAVVCEIAKPQMADLLARRPQIAESISLVIAGRRLALAAGMAAAGQSGEDRDALSAQILGRVRSFFSGVFGSREAPVGEARTKGSE